MVFQFIKTELSKPLLVWPVQIHCSVQTEQAKITYQGDMNSYEQASMEGSAEALKILSRSTAHVRNTPQVEQGPKQSGTYIWTVEAITSNNILCSTFCITQLHTTFLLRYWSSVPCIWSCSCDQALGWESDIASRNLWYTKQTFIFQ